MLTGYIVNVTIQIQYQWLQRQNLKSNSLGVNDESDSD